MILYAFLFPIANLIGFAGWWASNTNVKYDGECDYEDFNEGLVDGDRWEVCAGPGATLVICAFIFTLIAGGIAIFHSIT